MKGYLLLTTVAATSLLMFACQEKAKHSSTPVEESKEAKSLLQGIWVDAETEQVAFRAKGDTIYYPDSSVVPTYFMIAGDSFILGEFHYPILKHAPHLFWFRNHLGDIVKLVKSDNPNDVLNFSNKHTSVISPLTEVVKTDSVVLFNGERYHWYIAVNPTKYKIVKTSINDDGVAVEKIYYDNIIHISVFNGVHRLFSRDFKKNMFEKYVPEQFLKQSILGNIQFENIDETGLHFTATLCVPDGAACYMVSTHIGYDGTQSMSLLEC